MKTKKLSKVATLAVCGVPLLLMGCASTSDLKSDKPIATYESKKSAREFSACVADGWETQFANFRNTVNSRHTQTGYSVSITEQSLFGGNNVVFLVDSEDAKGGSLSKLYRGYAMGGSKVIAVVDGCK